MTEVRPYEKRIDELGSISRDFTALPVLRSHLPLVQVYSVPHLGDPGARRVHHLNVLRVKELHLFDGRAKGGEDDDVAISNI